MFVITSLYLPANFTVKPGVKYRDVGAVIQKHAQSNGFSVVRSYCGHGIHQLFHTAPNVPHYASMLILSYKFVKLLNEGLIIEFLLAQRTKPSG